MREQNAIIQQDRQDDNTRREHLGKRLKKLLPSTTGGIHVLWHDGEVITDADEIADILARHWEKVFRTRNDRDIRNHPLKDKWYNERNRMQVRNPDLTDEHVKLALKNSNNSAPGPDGIPYSAYRKCTLSADILCACARGLLSSRVRAPGGFHAAKLCCFPKKPVRQDPDLGDLYSPDSTRLLSIVNTDNRLIAAAGKFALEAEFAQHITVAQQGFVKDRSLNSNLLYVDAKMKDEVRMGNLAACILFDFAAAFPSILHDFMWLALEHFGISDTWRQFMMEFYKGNIQTLFYKGRKGTPFVANRRVRQGCPLSPFVFAMVTHVFLSVTDALPILGCTGFCGRYGDGAEGYHGAAEGH